MAGPQSNILLKLVKDAEMEIEEGELTRRIARYFDEHIYDVVIQHDYQTVGALIKYMNRIQEHCDMTI